MVGSASNAIGGPEGGGNLITGNSGDGIAVSDGQGTLIEGSSIVNNDGQGVDIDKSATIAANVITGNGGAGVMVTFGPSGVQITANEIFGNDKLGIDLHGGTEDSFGVTANDASDGDSGPNGLQNFPVLTSAVRNRLNGVTTISGSLNSAASTDFTIEFFVAIADPSGHGGGVIFLGSKTITTNSVGNRAFSFSTAQVAAGQVVTTTATATASESTSEFSANLIVANG